MKKQVVLFFSLLSFYILPRMFLLRVLLALGVTTGFWASEKQSYSFYVESTDIHTVQKWISVVLKLHGSLGNKCLERILGGRGRLKKMAELRKIISDTSLLLDMCFAEAKF